METDDFIKSLYNKDIELFKKVNKGDLHVHGILGSSRINFNSKFQITLPSFEKATNIYDLKAYIAKNIISYSKEKENYLTLLDLTIKTALDYGVKTIALSIDYRTVDYQFESNLENFINSLKLLKQKYIDKIIIIYDLGISRENFKRNDEKLIKKLIQTQTFGAIDLYGDELSQPIEYFINIYRYAEQNKLELKAHVGEYGTATDVVTAIKKLHLNTVQHGIAITTNIKAVNYAKKRNIKFNVCPTSNIKMGVVKNITDHPIKKMFDLGLIVTINTDDQLIFENSLYDEYIKLLDNNIFSAEELNCIRKNSII